MRVNYKLAPSILAADFARLGAHVVNHEVEAASQHVLGHRFADLADADIAGLGDFGLGLGHRLRPPLPNPPPPGGREFRAPSA